MEDRINYEFQKENGEEDIDERIANNNNNNNNIQSTEEDLDDNNENDDEIDQQKEQKILTDYNQMTTNHVKLNTMSTNSIQPTNTQQQNIGPTKKNSLYYLEELSTNSAYTYRVVYPVDSNL